jgi:hypothetical protein
MEQELSLLTVFAAGLLGILMITGKLTLITAKLGFLNELVW